MMRAEEAMALKATKKRCLSTAVVVGETAKRKVRGKKFLEKNINFQDQVMKQNDMK